jgi:hypothetical protein
MYLFMKVKKKSVEVEEPHGVDGADLAEDEGDEVIDTSEKLPKWIFKRMKGGELRRKEMSMKGELRRKEMKMKGEQRMKERRGVENGKKKNV